MPSRISFLLPVLALALSACDSPPVEPWHTEQLGAEFSVERTDISSFDAYRALESAVFNELQSRVYGKVGVGPSFAIVRFSAGSASDPQRRDPDWNRSFELISDAPVGGVLLLHGLTDSPYSLRALGQRLHAEGYHVLGLRFPGHGTAPSGLLEIPTQE